jgi:hypothetical protein
MHFSLPLLIASALQVSAFPSAIKREASAADCPFAKRDQPLPRLLQEKSAKKKRASTFDATAQYVDTAGAHAYVKSLQLRLRSDRKQIRSSQSCWW